MDSSEEIDVIEPSTESISFEEEEISEAIKPKENKGVERHRVARLPLSRVKHIMKMDPDTTIISVDAVYLTTKATELFIEFLGLETVKFTNNAKRKTVLKRDLEKAIEVSSNLCFLDGTLD